MLGLFRRLIGRPLDPQAVKEKKLLKEKKKAEKKLAVLRGLFRRQSNERRDALRFDLYDVSEFINLYTTQSKTNIKKIPIEECIEGLQRTIRKMKLLEVSMKKHKLGLFPWMSQSWRNYRNNRAYDREEARRLKEYNRRMDSIPFRP